MQPDLFDITDLTHDPASSGPVHGQPVPAPDEGPRHAPGATARLVFATDGSCLRNPGPGGWAAALVIADRWPDKQRWIAGGESDTTNNRMELEAIAAVLQSASEVHADLVIQTDSRYSIDAVTKWVHGWKKRGWRTGKGQAVKNQDLVQLIDAQLSDRASRGLDVQFVWVKGHAGQEANEFVDDRARRVAEQLRDRDEQLACGPGLAL